MRRILNFARCCFCGVWSLILGILVCSGFGVRGQTPPPPANAVNPLSAPVYRTNAVVIPFTPSPSTNSTATVRTTPRTFPPPRSDSIIVPSSPAGSTNTPGGLGAAPADQTTVITPSGTATNIAPEELLPAGMIDFRGADLNQVLQLYAELVNRTILRSAALPAPQIALKTQTPLTKREAIQALDAVLGLNGIAMVNVGDKFVKASQTQAANTLGAPFSRLDSSLLPEMGQYLTHVVQLKYAKPSELVQVLQPFASPIPNPILPIDSSGILVLRDFTENIKRMLELIREIDVSIPSEFEEEVIPIKYALASEIATALNSLSTGGGGTTVGSSSRSPTTTSRSSYGNRAGGGIGGLGGIGGGAYPGSTGGFNPQGAQTPVGGAGAAGGSFTDRLRGIIQRAAVAGEIQVLGQTKIIADERTNSLLIFASKDDMKMIKNIVSKLDIVLAQVLIEAVIISVSLDNSRDLGVSYLGHPQTSGKFTGVGALNNGNFLSPGNFALSGGTNIAGSIPGGFSYLSSFGQDLDVTVTAAASDNRAKILQRPRLQTSHAVPASLFVGESRPYPSGSYYGGASFGGYAQIQQLQIGVTLEVTPLINPDGLVVMDIHQKIDSFENNVTIQGVGDVPVTSSKEASAKVAVRDHDTIILGGLIETDKHSNRSGIPFLMDIPLLGYLFRSDSKSEARNELIVLIRPTVLPTPEVAALTATAEKNGMPGIRSAEAEIRAEEAKRIKQEDKEERERMRLSHEGKD
jgi:general secretion pathway protein D